MEEQLKQMMDLISSGQREMKERLEDNQKKMEDKFEYSQREMKEKLEDNQKKMEENQIELKSSLEENQKKLEERLEDNQKIIEAKFGAVDKKIACVEEKFSSIDEKVVSVVSTVTTVENKLTRVEEDVNRKIEELEQRFSDPATFVLSSTSSQSRPTVKLSTYDGKTAWSVYKTQLDVVSAANSWDNITKAFQLAAALRGEAADILQTLPVDKRADFQSLTGALELRFGESHLKDFNRLQLKSRRQKAGETLQELAAEIEKLSQLAFSECPTDVRDGLALQYFVDAIRDPEIQQALRIADNKDLKSALVYAMKIESAQQATKKEHRFVRGATAETKSTSIEELSDEIRKMLKFLENKEAPKTRQQLQCFKCGKIGHIQKWCPTRRVSRNDTPQQNQEN
jgi:hypothetical protein